MTAIYLSEADVQRLIDMPTAVQAIDEAFRQWAAGKVDNVPRDRARGPGVVLHSMCAAAPYLGLVGWKTYTTTASSAHFLVGLCDATLGNLVALIEADRLGQIRTGATTAVAVRCMSAPGLKEMGLFGAGLQARSQLAGVAAVCPLKIAYVYSRNPEKRHAFADAMSKELNIDVRPVDRPQEATEDLPLVVAATTSSAPVFDGRFLAEGALVCAVGANWRRKAEIDAVTIRRATHVVCDSVPACKHEAGDFAAAMQSGDFDWSRAVNLADVVAGRAIGSSRHGGISLFKSVGLAVEDVALGAVALERARAAGVGTPLPF